MDDPKLRKDGKCAECGKPRRNAHWNKYGGDQAVFDPFCSMECCRAWHGCSLPPAEKRPVGVQRGKTGDAAAEKRRAYRHAHPEEDRAYNRAYKRKWREEARKANG